MKPFNVLLTCASNKTNIIDWIRKSVSKFDCKVKVFAGDSNSQAVTRYFCDIFWHMPKTKKSNFKKILKYCLANNIKIIIPSSDQELYFWSTFCDTLKKNKIYVMVSSKDAVNICLNKLNFYKKLYQLNSTIFTSNKLNDFKKNQKLVAKKRIGSGSKNIYINKSRKELQNHNLNKQDYIYQKFVKKGREVSIDCFFSTKDNKLINLVPRYRDTINHGESSLTSVINKKKFIPYIDKIALKINFFGHVMFQGFISNKKLLIFECNPRIGGASFISYYNSMDSIYYFIFENLLPKKKLRIKTSILPGSKLITYKKTKFLR